MDLFKLGLRSVLGIALPGAVLATALIYSVLTSAWAFGQPMPVSLWVKEGQATIIVLFFLLSYVLGSVLRLNSADRLDRASGALLRRKNPTAKEDTYWAARLDFLKAGSEKVPQGFDSWVWMAEAFPYPAWQLRSFRLYHPLKLVQFFERYRQCMWHKPDSQDKESMRHELDSQGKEFFNFCKLSIAASCRVPGDALLEEVHYAEATVRFYAGVHLALVLSCWALVLVLPLQLWVVLDGQRPGKAGIVAAGLSAGLAAGAFAMSRQIVARFRTLRLREVGCVYEAFYLTSPDSLVHAQPIDRSLLEDPSEGHLGKGEAGAGAGGEGPGLRAD